VNTVRAVTHADQWTKAFGKEPRQIRSRTAPQRIAGWALALPGTKLLPDPTVLTPEQARLVLTALDPVLLDLRRYRSAVARLDNGYTCNQCGQQFKAARSDAKYCSSACRQKAHRLG
jgi:hypothetical protein